MARFLELAHVLDKAPHAAESRSHEATCLHAPFHRFEDGDDLGRIPLAAVAGIPGLVADLRGLPREGFRFFAVPLRIASGASFPVRAFADLDSGNGSHRRPTHGPLPQ